MRDKRCDKEFFIRDKNVHNTVYFYIIKRSQNYTQYSFNFKTYIGKYNTMISIKMLTMVLQQ